jgi:hypothetical protein
MVFQYHYQVAKCTINWCRIVEVPLSVQIVRLGHGQIAKWVVNLYTFIEVETITHVRVLDHNQGDI